MGAGGGEDKTRAMGLKVALWDSFQESIMLGRPRTSASTNSGGHVISSATNGPADVVIGSIRPIAVNGVLDWGFSGTLGVTGEAR